MIEEIFFYFGGIGVMILYNKIKRCMIAWSYTTTRNQLLLKWETGWHDQQQKMIIEQAFMLLDWIIL